jgi:TIR domain-containing protein
MLWKRSKLVFISYASEQRGLADAIAVRLRTSGHRAFVDHHDLEPAVSFDIALEAVVRRCQLFIFLVSPESVSRNRYTLTELRVAERCWPDPTDRVLPILVSPTAPDTIPAYLAQLHIVRLEANPVRDAVQAALMLLARQRTWPRRARPIGFLAVLLIAIGMLAVWLWRRETPPSANLAPAASPVGVASPRVEPSVSSPAAETPRPSPTAPPAPPVAPEAQLGPNRQGTPVAAPPRMPAVGNQVTAAGIVTHGANSSVVVSGGNSAVSNRAEPKAELSRPP